MRKLAIVAAVAAVALAACGGAKQIGYIGASSGVKPNALKIVEVDAETGEIAVRGSLPVANATYGNSNKMPMNGMPEKRSENRNSVSFMNRMTSLTNMR